jgi:hypothetical protein
MSKLGDALKANNKKDAIDKINTISDGDWKKESSLALKELGGKQTSTSSKSSSSSSSSSGVANITSIFDVKQSFSYDNNEVTSPFDLAGKVVGNGFNLFKDIKLAGKEVLDQLTLENNVRTAVNEKIGISGDLSEGLRREMMDSYPAAIRMGYGISQVTELMTDMMESSGRFNLISSDTLIKSFSSARAFVGSLGDMGKAFTEFEKVGIGAGNAIDAINQAGKNSLSLGLVAKKTITDIRENIEKLNRYGFKDGIEGLATMSRRAKEFRMDMNDAFTIADKVMDPEKAIALTANLQVLGGAIGDFNDPLKLMYMSTNNVEGLQDAIIKASGSLATYNQQQGRFEITGINIRRAKAMADELGISYESLTRGAVASQERLSASNELMAKGFTIPEKDKEFITNLSKMDNGKMVIEIPQSISDKFQGQSKIALSDLTQKQIEVLQDNRKAFEAMSPADIARDQVASVKNIERDLSAMWALQKIQALSAATGKGGLNLNEIGANAMKNVSGYTDKFLSEKRGLFSEGNKEKISAAVEDFKNSPEVKARLENLNVLTQLYGAQNTMVKKITESYEKENKRLENAISGNNTPQTKTIVHEHKFGSIPGYVDDIGRTILKNPTTINEWADKNMNDYTTQKLATNSRK